MITSVAVAVALLVVAAPVQADAPWAGEGPWDERSEAKPVHEPPPAKSSTRLLVAGVSIGGAGLLLATGGWSAFAGIHAGNPGKGTELSGFDDPHDARRTLRTSRAMAGLGIGGLLLAGVGVALVTTWAVRRHRQPQLALQLLPTGATLTARF